MRVWVTRARPAADDTAARLVELGHQPVVAPLIEAYPRAGVDPGLGAEIGALAFTSVHGVTAFAALTPDRSRPAFAVGETTASAARAAGFTVIGAGDGGVDALAAAIVAGRGDFQGGVAHPGAADPAGDLTGALLAAGIPVKRLVVYETRMAPGLPQGLAETWPEAVLLHSPKAARALARLLPPAWAPHLTAYALSSACAAPLAELGLARLVAAPFPREAALLKLLSS